MTGFPRSRCGPPYLGTFAAPVHARIWNGHAPLDLERLVSISYDLSIDRRMVMSARNTAKLSAKFQISIPKAVRTARRWQAGQEFAFISKGEGVLLVPVPKPEDLAGLVRGAKAEDYRDRTDRV
jgi:AbrB family looped-hinge helix DNA binding protein